MRKVVIVWTIVLVLIVAGLTYFGLRNEAKLEHAGKLLNEKFGSKDMWTGAAEAAGNGFNLKTIKKGIGKVLAYAAGSKTKLAILTTGKT